jgi:hypothetical protein
MVFARASLGTLGAPDCTSWTSAVIDGATGSIHAATRPVTLIHGSTGQPAPPSELVDLAMRFAADDRVRPDASVSARQVGFSTSGNPDPFAYPLRGCDIRAP